MNASAPNLVESRSSSNDGSMWLLLALAFQSLVCIRAQTGCSTPSPKNVGIVLIPIHLSFGYSQSFNLNITTFYDLCQAFTARIWTLHTGSGTAGGEGIGRGFFYTPPKRGHWV